MPLKYLHKQTNSKFYKDDVLKNTHTHTYIFLLKLTRNGGGEDDSKKHVNIHVHMTRYPVSPTIVSSIVQNRQPHVSAKLLLTLNWARQNATKDISY